MNLLRGRHAAVAVVWALVAVLGACSPNEPIAADPVSPTPVQDPPVTPPATAAQAPSATATPTDPIMVRLEYGDEADQFGDLVVPALDDLLERAPVVVLIHGGFWRQGFDLTLMDPLAADLAERGYASWNIEYARVGGAGGWPRTGDDVAAAIDELAVMALDYQIDLGRVVVVGHSAGGHLALWSLGRDDAVVTPAGAVGLGAVVQLAYFAESAGLLGGTISDVPDVYDDAAPVLDPDRVVLVQGGDDRIVPRASLRLAVEAGVRVEVIDGDNHFDLIDPASASWTATIDILDELLTPQGS